MAISPIDPCDTWHRLICIPHNDSWTLQYPGMQLALTLDDGRGNYMAKRVLQILMAVGIIWSVCHIVILLQGHQLLSHVTVSVKYHLTSSATGAE